MRGGPISSSRKSFGSRPAAAASSATNDWIAKACGMLLTPSGTSRCATCAGASPVSMRMFGTANGVSTRAHAELDVGRVLRVGREDRQDGRRRAAVQPRDRLAAGVEPGLEALDRHGVVEAVLEVVLARPGHLDRRAAHRLRQQRRLDHEVGLRLAAEAAAEQRDVDRHLLGRPCRAPRRCRRARRLRALHRRPDLRTCRPRDRATAAGGSIVRARGAARSTRPRSPCAPPTSAPPRRRPRCARPCRACAPPPRAAPGRRRSRRPCSARRPR